MNKLQCFKVICIDKFGEKYIINVASMNKEAAMKSAEYNLRECKHIEAKAIKCEETDKI
jgi:hypothetical protein